MKNQWKSVNNLHDTNVNTNNNNTNNSRSNTNNPHNNNNNLTPDASNNVNATPKSPKPSKSARSFQANHPNLSFSKIKSNIKKLFSYSSATKSQSSMEEARSPSVSSLEDLAPYNTQLMAHQLSVSSSRSTNEINNKENISSSNSPSLNRTHFTVGVASGLTLKNSVIQNNAMATNLLLPPLPPPQVPSNVSVGYNRSESDQSPMRRNSNAISHPTQAGNNDSSYSNNLKKNAALNLKIVTSNTPLNFYNDRETLEDLKQKLSYLTEEDHLQFQKLGFNLLYEQCQIKNAHIQHLDKEVQEMNAKLVTKNETLRVQFEIDALKNEIRALTNEKAELEMKIIQNSYWACAECKFKNNNQLVCCQMCKVERNANETFICSHCNSRNSIFEQSCRNCQAYLPEVNNPPLACSEHSNHSSLSRNSSSNGIMNSSNYMYEQNNNNSSARTTPSNSNHSSSANLRPETPKLTHRPPPPIPSQQQHQSSPSPQFYLGSQTSVPNRQTSSSSSGSSCIGSTNIYPPHHAYNIRPPHLNPSPTPIIPPPPPYSSTIGQPSIPFVPAANTNASNIRNVVASNQPYPNSYNPNR